MRKTLLLLGMLISSSLMYAQQNYSIEVTDSKTGNPVANASATVKSTRKGATTGLDGTCKVQAKENDILEVTCIGYDAKLVTLTAATEVTVSLDHSALYLGDIVILGTRGAPRAKTETAV